MCLIGEIAMCEKQAAKCFYAGVDYVGNSNKESYRLPSVLLSDSC